MAKDYDLLIVGGGLVGGCLALALRGAALRYAVVEAASPSEREASPQGDRALALSAGTVQVLRQLGVWTRVAHRATPITRIHVSDRGHLGKVRMNARQEGVEALGYVITARILESAVMEAVEQAAVPSFCPAEVVGMHGDEARGAHLKLRSGGEVRNLSVSLIVGADGGGSTVRKLAEIDQLVRDYGQTAIVTEVRSELPNQFTAYERFTRSGPLALLPTDKNQCSVVWTQTHECAQTLLEGTDCDFREALQDAFGHWLGRLELCAPRIGFPLKLIRGARMTGERVALVGNAMHQIHPVAGQGFNLGLRDVAALAETLRVAAEFRDDIGERRLLDRFERRRRKDLERVIGFTDSLVRLFSDDSVPLVAGRNFGLLTLERLLPVKHRLARYAMGLTGRSPRLS